MRRLTLALLSAAVATSAAAADAPKPRYGDWGFDAAGMDAKARPGDGFWRYANGGWDAATAIPADKTRYGVDHILSDGAETQVRAILEEPPAAAGAQVADAAKVHAAYGAFMDEARIEALGARPLQPDLDAIRAARTRGDLAELGGRHGVMVPAVFDVGIGPDDRDPDRYAVGLGQSGLGLPDRDYYLRPEFAAKKAAYRAYVAQMLTLIDWPDADRAATRHRRLRNRDRAGQLEPGGGARPRQDLQPHDARRPGQGGPRLFLGEVPQGRGPRRPPPRDRGRALGLSQDRRPVRRRAPADAQGVGRLPRRGRRGALPRPAFRAGALRLPRHCAGRAARAARPLEARGADHRRHAGRGGGAASTSPATSRRTPRPKSTPWSPS